LVSIENRQVLAVIFGKQGHRVCHRVLQRQALGAARDDPRGVDVGPIAPQGVRFGLVQNGFKVFSRDVNELAHLFQCLLKIFSVETLIADGGLLRHRQFADVRFRVAHPRQVVVDQSTGQQAHRVEHHRPEDVQPHGREFILRGNDTDRHRSRRRVQAAEDAHQHDGRADCHAGGNDGVAEQLDGDQRHQRGNQVAAEDRPRLRERSGGHGEQQHRRCPHRPQ
nr:hypothetical protein [Tanacetum cinerariifolium]